jgi:hypothetical protein
MLFGIPQTILTGFIPMRCPPYCILCLCSMHDLLYTRAVRYLCTLLAIRSRAQARSEFHSGPDEVCGCVCVTFRCPHQAVARAPRTSGRSRNPARPPPPRNRAGGSADSTKLASGERGLFSVFQPGFGAHHEKWGKYERAGEFRVCWL